MILKEKKNKRKNNLLKRTPYTKTDIFFSCLFLVKIYAWVKPSLATIHKLCRQSKRAGGVCKILTITDMGGEEGLKQMLTIADKADKENS